MAELPELLVLLYKLGTLVLAQREADLLCLSFGE